MEDRAINDLDAEIAEMEKTLSTPTEEPTESTEVEEPKLETESTDKVIAQLRKELAASNKRFNNYKPRTDITIRDLRNELLNLRSEITNLQAENAKLKADSTPIKNVGSYFSEEEREILGETTVEALDRSVKDIVDSKVAPLQKQLELERKEKLELIKARKANAANEARENFANQLRAVVPDFEDIIGNKDFRLRWIKEVDPMSGITREQLFTRAESDGDISRVASFFKDYKKETKSGAETLEEHVTPAGVSGDTSAVSNTSSSEFDINERFIDKFYDDLTKGSNKYKGKKGQELARRTEAAIDQWVSAQFSKT